jgi:hypothetical protein
MSYNTTRQFFGKNIFKSKYRSQALEVPPLINLILLLCSSRHVPLVQAQPAVLLLPAPELGRHEAGSRQSSCRFGQSTPRQLGSGGSCRVGGVSSSWTGAGKLRGINTLTLQCNDRYIFKAHVHHRNLESF